MGIDRKEIKRILLFTLSNLGDIILTIPVVEVLLREFPGARLDVMAGPNGTELLEKHPKISELIIYDKFKPLKEKLNLISDLRKKHYSLIVDLRHTLIPYLLQPPYRSLPFKRFSRHLAHKKDIHLWQLKALGINIKDAPLRLYIEEKDRLYARDILKDLPKGKIVIVNAGAKSHIKKWTKEGFAYVINKLKEEFGVNILMTGTDEDRNTVSSILDEVKIKEGVINLVGKTTVRQVIALLENADLLITNDSAPLHMASILGTKTLALFGPTDFHEYGPFAKNSAALTKPLACSPCRQARCAFSHECMRLLKKERVYAMAKEILECKDIQNYSFEPNRVLLARTDRIGDVVLSTPAIKAVWDNLPNSYIAFMVQPYTKSIVEDNPYIDEIILFDKKKEHRGIFGTLKFAYSLRNKNFDMAIVLHPTHRVHISVFLAGIRERVGYDKKSGFLLTKRISHAKQLGKKHELEYTLDILRDIGIEPRDKTLFVPVNEEAKKRVDAILASSGVAANDIIVGIHPAAGGPSRRWHPVRFAQLAARIMDDFGVKAVIVTGPSDVELADQVVRLSGRNPVNLAGRLSLGELIALLKRCALFISNDSGPVHVAAAVGTPVIAIFGRRERGVSPKRWGPVGENNIVIRKDVGCRECLVDDCEIDFECLKQIEVKDVLEAVYKFKDKLRH